MIRSNLRRGFTLIELLLVVIIIGIVAAIALPRFSDAKDAAYKSTLSSDLRTLVTSMELAFNSSNNYPSDVVCVGGGACAPAFPAGSSYSASPDVRVATDTGAATTTGWHAGAAHAKLDDPTLATQDGRCINVGQPAIAANKATNGDVATSVGGFTVDVAEVSGNQYECATDYNADDA